MGGGCNDANRKIGIALFSGPLLNEEEDLKLEALHAMTLAWCKELGIERLNPATGKTTDAVPDSLGK